MKDSYRFDLRRFVADLGGRRQVSDRLAEMGIDVKPTTVTKWIERDNIDMVYVTNLFAHTALTGTQLSFQKYLKREDRPHGPRLPRQPSRRDQ